jgi:hypothetical protein
MFSAGGLAKHACIVAVALTVAIVAAAPASAYPGYRSHSSYASSYSYYTPSYYRPLYYRPVHFTYLPTRYGYSRSSYYGQLNAAGFPKNQYVSGYITRSGRYVGGYWRNSPSDAYPTCKIIRC